MAAALCSAGSLNRAPFPDRRGTFREAVRPPQTACAVYDRAGSASPRRMLYSGLAQGALSSRAPRCRHLMTGRARTCCPRAEASSAPAPSIAGPSAPSLLSAVLPASTGTVKQQKVRAASCLEGACANTGPKGGCPRTAGRAVVGDVTPGHSGAERHSPAKKGAL